MRVVKLLRELVDIESISGREDRLINYLTDLLYEFEPTIFEKYNTKNILINQNSDFWVVTHLDTLPIKRDFEFDGEYVYGTGCCDAKASIASIILALQEVEDLNFGIALLSDEEEGGLGSKGVVEEFKPRRVLVMEPTQLKIAKEHYGSLELIVEVKGLSAHGSTPEYGVNAIEKAVELINSLKSLKYVFSIQEISGGSLEYVIPDRCRFRVDFVIPPELNVEDVEKDVLSLLKDAETFVVEKANGFVSSDKICKIVEKAVEKARLPVEYGVMPSWTDAINFATAGWDVVVFGPGELHLCHTERERIKVEEVLKAKDVLVALNEVIQSSS